MWKAICTDKDCQWERVSATKIGAEFDAHVHQFYDGDWSHRVNIVEIPDEFASQHITVQNATTWVAACAACQWYRECPSEDMADASATTHRLNFFQDTTRHRTQVVEIPALPERRRTRAA